MSKRIRFICGCKNENFVLEDWTCHWKYAEVREPSKSNNWLEKLTCKYPKLRAIKYFLVTQITWR